MLTNLNAISETGGGQAHGNMLPFQVENFIVCLEETYPLQPWVPTGPLLG